MVKKASSILTLVCACALAALLCFACGCSKDTSDSENQSYQGTSFTLGDLKCIAYDQEIVVNADAVKKNCLAIYLHVTNTGDEAKSVMGSYNVKREQGTGQTLKVAVAYDTNGNAIHQGGKLIEPGESKDIALCFVLLNNNPVTITFGNEELGIKETTLTYNVSDIAAQ